MRRIWPKPFSQGIVQDEKQISTLLCAVKLKRLSYFQSRRLFHRNFSKIVANG